MLKKIVFIGPESSGMCIKLAEQLNTIWVPEACRLAAEEKKPLNDCANPDAIDFQFTLDDFISMAKRQNSMELEHQHRCDELLLCDNDTFALTIWCERYMGTYHDEIYALYKEATELNNTDKIYILTKPNVPFVQDGYRDGEHLREWMYHRFIDELTSKKMKYYVIDSPDYNKRYANIINIIKNL